MQDHYKTLGVNSSATQDEIRRAYRILARRYHPDVNPGKSSEEKFKSIASAYKILNDPKKRREYDADYDRFQIAKFAEKFKEKIRQSTGFRRPQEQKESAKTAKHEKRSVPRAKRNYEIWLKNSDNAIRAGYEKISKLFKFGKKKEPASILSVSIIEVSVSMKEAIFGQRKTIEIPGSEGARKVSVTIPAGVRGGSVLRLKQRSNRSDSEEIVVIIRVAQHPFLNLQNRGLVVEVPVSVSEALLGCNITLPGVEESILVKIPPASQSGSEIRMKGKGVLNKDGARGDLIYRLMIKVPESPDAVGIKSPLTELDKYYGDPVRKSFPSNLSEI